MSTHLTVIGATGGIGDAIVRAAERHGGLRVRAVNRGGDARVTDPTTERVAADVETADGARHAIAGTDVVVMAAQPPYHDWGNGRWTRMMQHVIDATREQGAKLVLVDNLYAFDSTAGPIREDSPLATNRKAVLREELAQQVLAAHGREGLRTTIGCFSDYLGPRSHTSVVGFVIDAAREGKVMRGLYELDVPHAWAFTDDMARMFLVLALDDRADGHRWVLPHGAPATQREVMDHVADALDIEARHGVYGPLMMRIGGLLDKDVNEVRTIRHQWEQPYLVDGSRFEATFGPQDLTPLADAVRRTVAAAGADATEAVAA